jgi:uncharacterized phage-associated protein
VEDAMANVLDVAAYILEKRGPMTAMKLQKLIYYCQAWHIVWQENTLFSSRIEAWIDGPVVPDLFKCHKGSLRVSSLKSFGADSRRLKKGERGSVDAVLKYYGDKDPQWLSDLTHMEIPWREARAGLPDNARATRAITTEALGRYYGSL